MIKAILVAASALLVSMNAGTALAQQAAAVLEEYSYVSKVNVGEDNHLFVSVRGNFKPSHGCSNLAYVRSKYPLNDSRARAWLQMATASFLSRTKVHIMTRGCVNGGNSGYPVLIKFQLFQE